MIWFYIYLYLSNVNIITCLIRNVFSANVNICGRQIGKLNIFYDLVLSFMTAYTKTQNEC